MSTPITINKYAKVRLINGTGRINPRYIGATGMVMRFGWGPDNWACYILLDDPKLRVHNYRYQDWLRTSRRNIELLFEGEIPDDAHECWMRFDQRAQELRA